MLTSQLTLDILLFIIGFVLLIGGAELMVRGASRLAARFNVPAIVIGLTVVAFGTSLPELLVSVVANLRGNGGSDIAIGNIVGSNIANLSLILGVAGLLAAVHVERHLIRREFPLLILVSTAFVAMAWNGHINRIEGVIMVLGLIAFTYYSYTASRTAPQRRSTEILDLVDTIDSGALLPSSHPLHDIGLIIAGLAGLLVGADWLVNSATAIALAVGVSELVIGLTLVALGTSLPELATTIIAIRRGEGDIAIGNAVGSNLFNTLMIGGISATIKPLVIPVHMLSLDFPVMLGLTILAYLLVLHNPHQIARWQGALLTAIYIAYTIGLFVLNGAHA